ncbi:MAG: hypothetical protein AAGG51_26045 [Cyanobacteria bacterium P01_G01_bin.54]
MKTKNYPLKRGGPDRLVVSYAKQWQDITLKIDDTIIGTIPDKETLKAGVNFTLEDDSILEVGLAGKQLKISRGGKPIPGSAEDPQLKVDSAVKVIDVIALLRCAFGILAIVGLPFLVELGFTRLVGIFTLVEAAIFVILGILVKRLSKIALMIAIALVVLGLIYSLTVSLSSGNFPAVGVGIACAFLYIMIQGIPAIQLLKDEKAALEDAME